VTQATSALPGHQAGHLRIPTGGRRPARLVARSLFLLTKPRIIELLLVTTVPTMMLAQRGLPSVRLLGLTLLGGALAAASANTLNCYLDRDIDALMKAHLAPPAGRQGTKAPIKPREALASGIVLGALSTVLLGLLVNWLSAALADGRSCSTSSSTPRPQAPDGIQHRDRRGGRLLPRAGRLGRRDRTVSLPAIVLFAVIFSGRRRTSGRWR